MEWNHGESRWSLRWRPSQWQSAMFRRFRRRQIPAKPTETSRKANDERTSRNPEIWWYSYIYIYSVWLASFWGYSNAECSNHIEPTRKSCMTCCFLHPHFSWPAILSWRFREQALSTAALRQLWWRSWSAKRRSRALNSAISLHRRGVRLFCFTEFEKSCYKKTFWVDISKTSWSNACHKLNHAFRHQMCWYKSVKVAKNNLFLPYFEPWNSEKTLPFTYLFCYQMLFCFLRTTDHFIPQVEKHESSKLGRVSFGTCI